MSSIDAAPHETRDKRLDRSAWKGQTKRTYVRTANKTVQSTILYRYGARTNYIGQATGALCRHISLYCACIACESMMITTTSCGPIPYYGTVRPYGTHMHLLFVAGPRMDGIVGHIEHVNVNVNVERHSKPQTAPTPKTA